MCDKRIDNSSGLIRIRDGMIIRNRKPEGFIYLGTILFVWEMVLN